MNVSLAWLNPATIHQSSTLEKMDLCDPIVDSETRQLCDLRLDGSGRGLFHDLRFDTIRDRLVVDGAVGLAVHRKTKLSQLLTSERKCGENAMKNNSVHGPMNNELAYAFPFWRMIRVFSTIVQVIRHVEFDLWKCNIEKRVHRLLRGPYYGFDAVVVFVAQEEVPAGSKNVSTRLVD